MNNKFVFLALIVMCFGLLIADTTNYEWISTSHPDKILVKEIKQIPISGFDSSGHMITLYQTVTNEKYLDLYKAFDIGIRYHSDVILLDALAKLKSLRKSIDVSDAIVTICHSIQDENTPKNIGYVVSGIIAGCSILPLLGGSTRTVYGYYSRRHRLVEYEFDAHVTIGERLLGSALFLGFGGLVWWLTRASYRDKVTKFGNVLRVLLLSPVCFVTEHERVRKALLNVENRLDSSVRACVINYLINGCRTL